MPTSRASNIAVLRPDPRKFEKLIRELALDSKNVRWRAKTYETHAESQMEWRDITDEMMFEVLRTGFLSGEIERGKNRGEWKAKMVKQIKGRREVGVVTLVINE